MEAPRVERRIVPPVLQVAAAEVPELAELALLDQLARQADRRYEAVVKAAHVLDARPSDPPPDLVALIRSPSERFLAEHVLPRLCVGDRLLSVQRVRPAVVEETDSLVGDEFAPVGRPGLVPVALCRRCNGLLVAARDRDQLRHERRRPGHVGELAERVRVRLAHERVAEHADADLPQLAGRLGLRLRADARALLRGADSTL